MKFDKNMFLRYTDNRRSRKIIRMQKRILNKKRGRSLLPPSLALLRKKSIIAAEHIGNFADGDISGRVDLMNDIPHADDLISVYNKVNHRFIAV